MELETGEGGSDLIVVLSCLTWRSTVVLLNETEFPAATESFEFVVCPF